jgi:hypothetical protein
MKRYLPSLVCAVALFACGGARADEPADTSAPKRLSDIVRQADYVVLDFGEYGHPQEVKIADRKFMNAIAQVFAEATYIPRDHSFSVSTDLFAFYINGKLRMAVSLQPGSVVRLSNARAEENFEISRKTIDALRQLYQSKKASRPSEPAAPGGRGSA